jgi:hypothetical protein
MLESTVVAVDAMLELAPQDLPAFVVEVLFVGDAIEL